MLQQSDSDLIQAAVPATAHACGAGPYAAEGLVEALYALGEPWCTRFLFLVSSLYTGAETAGRLPSREQVVLWLNDDAALRMRVRQLLETWTRVRV
jgi:hypothetical protein